MKILDSRLSAVEADGCQVSRPLCGLHRPHSDCLRAQHDDVEEEAATAAWQGPGRRMAACWALLSWRLDTGPPMGDRKWTGATRQERVEPHRQFTGIDDFTARATSTATYVDAIDTASTPNQLVMASRYWTVLEELKNRPFRTATHGLKWAAGHVLATFSNLQRRPMCSSLINDLNRNSATL
jgi:hypothetical protein